MVNKSQMEFSADENKLHAHITSACVSQSEIMAQIQPFLTSSVTSKDMYMILV